MGDVLIRCSVCTSLLDEEDLFCANCGTECPPRERPNAAQDRATRTSRDNFECSGCGASMSYDASAKSLRCPFCGSLDMVARPDIAVLNPSTVVPFRFEQSEALARLREWLGKGFWRPGALARQAAVVKITAVYVPYWVFQAQTHTFWTADTNQTPPGARGDWYPLSGEHHGSYAGVLVGASGALTAQETAALQPFDLDSGVPAAQVDLDNVVVEQLALPRKYARPWRSKASKIARPTPVAPATSLGGRGTSTSTSASPTWRARRSSCPSGSWPTASATTFIGSSSTARAARRRARPLSRSGRSPRP